MNIVAINRTIQEMCAEVVSICDTKLDWRSLTEEQLLEEVTVCIFSSQMIFEIAEAAAKHVKERGLLRPEAISGRISNYKKQLVAALSTPLIVTGRTGVNRQARPRFKNRLASLLAATLENIYACGTSLRKILLSVQSARGARALLVDLVWGFGPKQASLFLRRIGYCYDLAVLDTHVLDYLRLSRGIEFKPGMLAKLSSYELLEIEFKEIAAKFGHSVGCVDLATWITMRVAKRETALWV